MENFLRKIIRKILNEEIGRDFKTIKFMDQVDVLKDPRFSVNFFVIKKNDEVQHQVQVKVVEPGFEKLSKKTYSFKTNEEAEGYARDEVRKLIRIIDQQKNKNGVHP
jgi:hypothetical protein